MAEPFTWNRVDEGLSNAELIRILNTRLPRIARELATLETDVGGGGVTASQTLRFLDAKVYIPGLNSGDAVTALNGTTRYGGIGQSAFLTGPLFAYRAGAASMLYQEVDGRRALSPQNAGAAYSTAYLRPYAISGTQLFALDFRDTFRAVTSTPNSSCPSLMSTTIMAWLRKKLAGDSSSCRFTLGYADNTFLSPTALIARCGVMGDGAGGYRFGSVNCPDGGAVVENAASDIDANSVQPAELVAPSTNWFHVAIKLVPPTPTVSGKWGAYLNGGLQATYTTSTNFPRGSAGTDHDYNRVEGIILANESAVATPYLSDVRVTISDDLTLGSTLTF